MPPFVSRAVFGNTGSSAALCIKRTKIYLPTMRRGLRTGKGTAQTHGGAGPQPP
jgi:hypothetical protein